MYHYIRERSNDYPYSRHLEINNFTQICQILKKKYLSLNVTEGLISHDLEKVILLTFDDGLKDHLEVAEILTKNELKGTFYIPVQPYIKKDILPVHKAHLICSKLGGSCLQLLKDTIIDLGYKLDDIFEENNLSKYSDKYNKHNDDFRIKEFKRIINYYGRLNLRSKILNEILKKLGINRDPRNFYLTTNEIKHINYLGHEIGSHGLSHTLLSRLNKENQKREIEFSKQFLESIVKNKVNSFCYPYGTKDSYTEETIKILKKCKYQNAVSVEYRDISKSDLIYKKFEIPRYDCKNFCY